MSLAHWILTAVTPWFLATPKGKRKSTQAKRARRSAPKARARAKPAARRAPKAAPRAKRKPTRARAAAPAPSAPTPPPKLTGAPPPTQPTPPIGRAILLTPENDKYVDTRHPTFRWLSVGGATRYEIAWGDDPNFLTAHILLSIATEATVPVEEPLQPGKTYYWRVRGGNAVGWSVWSDVGAFHVLAETP